MKRKSRNIEVLVQHDSDGEPELFEVWIDGPKLLTAGPSRKAMIEAVTELLEDL